MFTTAALALALLTSGGSLALTLIQARRFKRWSMVQNVDSERLSEVQTDVQLLRKRSLNDLLGRLDQLEESSFSRMDGLSDRLDRLEESSSLMLEAGKTMEESIAALSTRVDQAGETVKMETEAIAALKEQGLRTEEEMDLMAEQLDGVLQLIRQVVDSLRKEVSDAFAELAKREVAKMNQPVRVVPGPIRWTDDPGPGQAVMDGGGMDLTSAEQAAQLNEALATQLGDLRNRLQQLSAQQQMPS